MECRHRLRNTGYYHQSVQTGKDPKAIAAAQCFCFGLPKCQLCMENEGVAGRLDHPARENHRIIPITVNDSKWGFQYSPMSTTMNACIVSTENILR